MGAALTEPSDFNRKLLDHAKLENWGLYRNTRLDMADFLRKKRKTLGALTTYLEVSYLDANGPMNLMDRVDRQGFRESPPFDPSIATQAPRVIGEIYVNSQELKLSNTELKARYLQVATTLQRHLKTPVDPEDGWKELENELENYIEGF